MLNNDFVDGHAESGLAPLPFQIEETDAGKRCIAKRGGKDGDFVKARLEGEIEESVVPKPIGTSFPYVLHGFHTARICRAGPKP